MFIVITSTSTGQEYPISFHTDKEDAEAFAASARRRWTSVRIKEVVSINLKTYIIPLEKWELDYGEDEGEEDEGEGDENQGDEDQPV